MQTFDYTLTAKLAARTDAHATVRCAELQETLAIGDSDHGYQRSLSLQGEHDGGLCVVSRRQRKLARVQAVLLEADARETGLLHIGIVGLLGREGWQPDLAELRVEDRQVQLVVAEVPDAASGQAQRETPGHFHIRVPLQIGGFATGVYRVNVNGLEQRFIVVD